MESFLLFSDLQLFKFHEGFQGLREREYEDSD